MITYEDLGRKDYKETWDLQKQLFQTALQQKKEQQEVQSTVLFVEHNPVFTLGKSANESNLLFNQENLQADVFKIERGGDVTFHGPGQLVVYPIIDLEQFNMSLREYVFTLEQIIIEVLQQFDIRAERSVGASGVWLDVKTPQERKIAALGVKASRHVTMHGLAFNINTDLAWFAKINPCGFIDKGVTSLAQELGEEQDFKVAQKVVTEKFKQYFK